MAPAPACQQTPRTASPASSIQTVDPSTAPNQPPAFQLRRERLSGVVVAGTLRAAYCFPAVTRGKSSVRNGEAGRPAAFTRLQAGLSAQA